MVWLMVLGSARARPANAADAGASGGAPAASSQESGPPVARKPFSLLAPLPGEIAPPPARDNEYQLRRLDDGSGDLSYQGSAFEARIHRDGSVSFRDKTFTASLLPAWLPMSIGPRGPTLQGLLRNVFVGRPGAKSATPYAPRGDASEPPPETRTIIPSVTPFRPDPREACRYPSACFFDAAVMVVSVTGTFDLTEILMRMNGKDPYRIQKARFLAHTSDLRVRLAARAHGDDVRKATASLRAELESIAANENLSRAERRAVIQGLAAELDADTEEGRQARAQIEAFLRARFPPSDAGVSR
jgi:hypothetical protein